MHTELLFENPEGKTSLGRPRRRWDDNIKTHLTKTGYKSVDWIQLSQDRIQWWAFVNMVTNLWVP